MTEIDLRALVREAVARHLGQTPAFVPAGGSSSIPPGLLVPPGAGTGSLAHCVYVALVNPSEDCLIEPSVRCNHCGYCKTHGY